MCDYNHGYINSASPNYAQTRSPDDVLRDDFKSMNTVLVIYIREAQANGITLKFVFDGLDQPGKADCQAAIQKIQNEKLDLLKTPGSFTQADMAAAVGRSDPMQTAVIKTLIELGVAYEVAPYQADAQLVQAEAERRADYIWSSDTDMLAHGGQILIVDWNWTTGRAIVVTADALFNSTHGSDNRMLSILRKYKLAALQLMTVVKSDYHDIKGMGAKTWMDIVDEIGSVDVTVFANYLVSNVEKREKEAVSLSRLDKAQILDSDFTNKLLVCVSNFKDALVYDSSANRVISLGGKCAEEVNKMPHLGSLDLFEDSDILMKHVTGQLSGKHHVTTDTSPPDYLSPQNTAS